MRPVTSETFGLLIAYLISGLIVLWGLRRVVPELQQWVGTAGNECQTFGGFLNLTVASVGAGLTVSTVRWLVIDPVHHWTGIHQPAWRMRDFHARTAGLQVLIEAHYRYYQFYEHSARPGAGDCAMNVHQRRFYRLRNAIFSVSLLVWWPSSLLLPCTG